MNKADFHSDAEQYGDFYLYYGKVGSKGTTYLIGTADLTTPYIQSRIDQSMIAELQPNEVLVWSWSSDKLRVMDVTKIKKLTPLSAVLKNTRE